MTIQLTVVDASRKFLEDEIKNVCCREMLLSSIEEFKNTPITEEEALKIGFPTPSEMIKLCEQRLAEMDKELN
jgi:hypothetical protein